MQSTPRVPNESELEELFFFLRHWMRMDEKEADTLRDWMDNACIAVFDHYMTDCPGYAGKVMVVVWPGAPEMFDLFIWPEGGMRRVTQETAE